MNKFKQPFVIFLLAIAAALFLGVSTSQAQAPTKGYNQVIPEKIMTPDRVETRLGTLEYFDGIPTADTAALL